MVRKMTIMTIQGMMTDRQQRIIEESAELNEDYGNTIEADCWKDYDEVREDFAWFVDIPNSDGFLVAEAW